MAAPSTLAPPPRFAKRQDKLQGAAVDAFTRAIDELLRLVIQLGRLFLVSIITIQIWICGQLELPPAIQEALLVALAAMLILVALKLSGGLLRAAVVLVMLLIVIRILLPIIEH